MCVALMCSVSTVTICIITQWKHRNLILELHTNIILITWFIYFLLSNKSGVGDKWVHMWTQKRSVLIWVFDNYFLWISMKKVMLYWTGEVFLTVLVFTFPRIWVLSLWKKKKVLYWWNYFKKKSRYVYIQKTSKTLLYFQFIIFLLVRFAKQVMKKWL